MVKSSCTIERLLKGDRLTSHSDMEGGEAMEAYEALTLMFMFGMFILALLSYLRNR